jgi:AraC-like DNA-binding protein
MSLCVNTQRALMKQGCFVQMSKGPGIYPLIHTHPGIEIILVHSGGVSITAQDSTLTALPGSISVIPGSVNHSTKAFSPQFTRTVVHAADELCDSVEDIITGVPHHCSVELAPDAFDRCFWAARQLYALTVPPQQPRMKLMHTLVDLLCAELEEALESSQHSGDDCHTLLSSVIAYMNAHPDQPEELPELAHRFAISERHLCRLFNTYLNCSPQRYWLNLRLERACQLLNEQVPVTQIANQVGFESVRGFQRAFKRSFGVSPSHYLASAHGRDRHIEA